MSAAPRLPAHLVPLLAALRAPADALALDPREWDRVLRMARSARLHGVLARRLEGVGPDALPAGVADQLEAARAEAAFARTMLRYELREVTARLAEAGIEFMVLKGAAYVVQDLCCADGRMPSDLDIMVRRSDLDAAEARLVAAGWEGAEVDAYDDRYYREWAHQVPPLRANGHVMEVDLHHALLPPYGHVAIDPVPLWQASVERGGHRVLAPVDQVLHAIVHLFVDSDCTNRLRDLVDIAALIEEFAGHEVAFVRRLRDRAAGLGLQTALDDAAAFLAGWLGVTTLGAAALSDAATRARRGLIARRLGPPPADALPPCIDFPHAALLARGLWTRLPAHRVVLHTLNKAARAAGLRFTG